MRDPTQHVSCFCKKCIITACNKLRLPSVKTNTVLMLGFVTNKPAATQNKYEWIFKFYSHQLMHFLLQPCINTWFIRNKI